MQGCIAVVVGEVEARHDGCFKKERRYNGFARRLPDRDDKECLVGGWRIVMKVIVDVGGVWELRFVVDASMVTTAVMDEAGWNADEQLELP